MRLIDGDRFADELEIVAQAVEDEWEAEIFRMFADLVRKQPEIQVDEI